eukprot:1109630-Pelagomonas_calceolata.AAC.2
MDSVDEESFNYRDGDIQYSGDGEDDFHGAGTARMVQNQPHDEVRCALLEVPIPRQAFSFWGFIPRYMELEETCFFIVWRCAHEATAMLAREHEYFHSKCLKVLSSSLGTNEATKQTHTQCIHLGALKGTKRYSYFSNTHAFRRSKPQIHASSAGYSHAKLVNQFVSTF